MAQEEYYDEEVNDETVARGPQHDLLTTGVHIFKVLDVVENESGCYLETEVLPGGTVKGDYEKTHREYFDYGNEKWPRKKRTALAVACELTTREIIAEKRASQEPNPIEYLDAMGKVYVADIQRQTYSKDGKDKTVAKVNFDNIYHPSDAAVKRLGVEVNGQPSDDKQDLFAAPVDQKQQTTDKSATDADEKKQVDDLF